MDRLKRRAAFKAVAGGGRRVARQGFVIQSLTAEVQEIASRSREARFGFTVTRQIGNAVVRNRIRRRLKEAVRQARAAANPATDYVLVGRRAALTLPFQRLVTDLVTGFEVLSKRRDAGQRDE
jgi:ribonuclease P protein component